MAGVHVIWFSVPVTCICANVTTLLHFFTISCQCAHFFCIHQWSVHVVHSKSTVKLNLIVSLNVWRPYKWFTFHCYVVMSCILTTVRQFSTTSGPHWNVSYTLINTAGVVHYRSKSPFTYTFITHSMAGVHVIWFSVPFTHTTIFHHTCVSKKTCIYANVTIPQHFFTISWQYAHVFCIHQ